MRKIKLHYALFISFTLISSIPVLFLASWVQQSALEKEIASVEEKHLLVAKNLTGDLSRYVTDVESAFILITENLAKNNTILGLPKLLESLNFRYFLVIDEKANILKTLSPLDFNATPTFVPKIMDEKIIRVVLPYLAKTEQEPEKVFFSNMVRDSDNQATFFLFKLIAENRYAIGSISTKHIRKAQQAVIFGRRGHAAIVDRSGRAIAHPIENWVATMKDMSFLPPVKQMMKGNTGVSKFYTPAMKADMVAGYTTVAKAGWGVMIPQPFEELEERANDVQNISYSITIIGITLAGFISWFISGKLSFPINSIIRSAQLLRKGQELEQVESALKYTPYEMRRLVNSFNIMVSEIKEKNHFITETTRRLEEAQKIAHIGNWELNFETDEFWCSDEFYKICNVNQQYFYGSYQELLELIHPDDRKTFENAINHAKKEGTRFNIEHRILLPHQKVRMVHHEGQILKDSKNMIGVIHDISEIHEYQNKLHKQANYDELTGLPNRNLLLELLNQELIISTRNNRKTGIFAIDLDNFKSINDTHGMLIGDILLQQATARIKSCIRESDTLARYSGDKFTLILRNITNEKDCASVAENIIASMKESFKANRTESFLGASIGITIHPCDVKDTVSILRNTDIALHRSKKSGKNHYCFFKEEMDHEISQRVNLTNDLRKAVEQGELSVYYQPIVDLQSGEIKSAEALVRWIHPKHGFVSPVEFIPLAEESGSIGPLGLYVLETACKDAASWSNLIDNAPNVSVNLSVKQLKLGLSKSTVDEIITSSKLPANKLTFEITESLVINNIDEAIEWMRSIKDLGVSFSVDDFGTGYSSLSYLQRLPVDILKIDRSFIKDVMDKPEDALLVETIISIGKNLNLKLVAEGAEDKEQVEYLAKLKCDSVQGYYFSRPIPANEFAVLLKNWVPQKFS